jgi:thiamine kinase-like enzyme
MSTIAIEDAVAKVGMWAGRPLRFERIAAGITNLNWRITLSDPEEIFFLKIHGPGTESFIDREVAHEAAIKAGDAGIAPRLLFYDAADGIEVYEYLHGFRSCGVLETQHPTIRQNIVRAYKTVHATQSLSVAKDGFAQLDQHLNRLRQMGAELPRDFEEMLWQRRRAEQAIRASGMDLVACFNDGYVSNYMYNDDLAVKIIDWEYAANNDPYWDLTMFSWENFYTDPQSRRELIEIYDGAYRADIAARVHLYVGVASIVWGLWATYQSMTSSIPFDFGKYADLIFARGRMAMAVPEWERALVTV